MINSAETLQVGADLPPDVVDRTIIEVVWGKASRQANHLAVVAHSADGSVHRLTYAELVRQAENVASSMQELGIRAGDHVGILLGNTEARELFVTHLAVLRLGAVGVVVNPAFKSDELLHVLSLTECRLVVGTKAAVESVRVIVNQLSVLKIVVETSSNPDALSIQWTQLLAPKQPWDATFPSPKESDDASIIMTSGTTGRPKAVVLTHGNAVAGGLAMNRGWDIRNTDVMETPIPLFTSAGMEVATMGCFCAGATLIVDPRFDSEVVFQTVKEEQSTVLVVVPSMVIFMLEQFDPSQHTLESVRIIAFGASSMTVATIERATAVFPGAQLKQIYSMTESATTGTYLSSEFIRKKPGSVGRPVLCEMRVVDDQDRDVAHGQVGEILIRGPGVMRGYYRDPAATAEALSGGWLHTGDIGSVDQDGFFFHFDRKKDIIVRGGSNIGSVEVENVLLQHPSVLEVAVVGVPHPKLGEDVFAFVVKRPGNDVDAATLIAHCKELIADYKVPRRIDFIEKLPRNATGKVVKKTLRDAAVAIVSGSAPTVA